MTPSQEELLSAYLDGECDPEERTQVEALLLESSEARDWLAWLQGDQRSLRDHAPKLSLATEVLAANREKILTAIPTSASPTSLAERLQTWLHPWMLSVSLAGGIAMALLSLSPPASVPGSAPLAAPETPVVSLAAVPPALRPLGPRATSVLSAQSDDPDALVATLYLEEADVDVIWVLQ